MNEPCNECERLRALLVGAQGPQEEREAEEALWLHLVMCHGAESAGEVGTGKGSQRDE